MSLEENLRLASEFVNASNEQDWDRFSEFFANEEVGKGWAEFERTQWCPTFPEGIWCVKSMTAQDDRVVIEGHVHLTHRGTLNMWVTKPVPATGKEVIFSLVAIGKWKDGKLTEYHTYMCAMQILNQLGITENIDWSVYG